MTSNLGLRRLGWRSFLIKGAELGGQELDAGQGVGTLVAAARRGAPAAAAAPAAWQDNPRPRYKLNEQL